MISLSSKFQQVIIDLADATLPANAKILAFCNTDNDTAYGSSDLDFVIQTPEAHPLPAASFDDFREALQDADIPISIRILNWNSMTEHYKSSLGKEHCLLREANLENIPPGWKHLKIGEFAHLIRDSWEIGGEELPYVGLEHIGKGNLRLISIGSSNEVASNKYKFRSGDILFGKLRPYFRKICSPEFEGICSTDIWVIRANRIADPGFIHYFFSNQEFVDLCAFSAEGTRMPRASWRFVSNTKWSIPSQPEQKAISYILSSFDNKIDINQKINKTLEEIAKAIFKSWFVDFDPVRAKVDGRSTGIPPEISDLFPNKIVDSEIGAIPEGWEVRTISDFADCVGGATPSTKNPDFWEGGDLMWTSPKDLSGSHHIHLLETDKKITEAGLKKISSGLLPIGTVLLSSRAPIGYLAITTQPTAINQGYIALKSKVGISNIYLLHWCESNLEKIKSRASGTTFLEISKTAFRTIRVIAPPQELMEKYHGFVVPLYEKILMNSMEMQRLEELRDTLLPRLVSGELRIPNVKKFLEEAGI